MVTKNVLSSCLLIPFYVFPHGCDCIADRSLLAEVIQVSPDMWMSYPHLGQFNAV